MPAHCLIFSVPKAHKIPLHKIKVPSHLIPISFTPIHIYFIYIPLLSAMELRTIEV
jgi:hypothetical protein